MLYSQDKKSLLYTWKENVDLVQKELTNKAILIG